jgi:hypothetical protein
LLKSINNDVLYLQSLPYIFSLTAMILSGLFCSGQEHFDYYEISVYLEVDKLGGTEIPAIIVGEKVYLSIDEFFDYIKIKNTYSLHFDTISGFILNPEYSYVINRNNNTITYKGKEYNIPEGDIIMNDTGLYLDLDYFGNIFGLECTFNLRKLMVSLVTDLELPVIREIRLQSIRDNIRKLKNEKHADTTLKRNYPAFSMGMLDWSVISTQIPGISTNTRSSVAIGSIIAGGETNIVLNYDSDRPLTGKQQQYRWRFVNNNSPIMKQLLVGKINPRSTSSIYDPVVGVQISNTPTTYRRSYGEFTLSDYTKPGWYVELYVNNVLIDYQQADASGFYSFEVPIVYGNTKISLRLYGPWGEEAFKEHNISVPFNFVPQKKLEYNLSSGIVEDTSNSSYLRGELNYGLGRNITVSGGVEYLSSISSGGVLPFVNTSFSFGGNLLLAINYTHGVKAHAVLNYRLSQGLQINLDYTSYKRGQKAINNNYLEVRKAAFSLPIRKNKFSLFTRLTVSQYILSATSFSNSELLISGNMLGVSTNLSTMAIVSASSTPYFYSNLSFGFRLPGKINLRIHLQYDINDNQINSIKLDIEKRILKTGFITLSYEENIPGNARNLQFGVCFDLSFAQSGFNIVTGNKTTTLHEALKGSLQYNSQINKAIVSNRSGVGRGSMILLPFLDLNRNNKYDKYEPKIPVLDVKVASGRLTRNDKDSTIIISELEPYTDCFIEINGNNIDNIAWKLKFNSLNVEVMPNQLRLIEIPVHVMGEVSGMVMLKSQNSNTGIGRIKVNIYNLQNNLVKQILTEYDGYFSFIGLAPGTYHIMPDNKQLKKLNMVLNSSESKIEISNTIEGDFVGGLEFIISHK